MTLLDPFYPVVDSAAWVERLVCWGARCVQLRIKDQPVDAIRSGIRRALAACRTTHAQLIVNDYWQLALETGADFVHLGQDDLTHADLDAIRRGGLRLGISTHDHAELERALAARPDYVALGPVYHTTLKVMPWAPQGLDRVREWKRRIGMLPLVAIGGITLERAHACLGAGADALAMVSDITRHDEPEARTRAWLAAVRNESRA